ncbi:hypothetical protein Taro_047381 [Colocasia esculenta]|uniref:Uncharacterized protein n=1 Tax=Colocasia esculenta TaxID=4460 RepID=A0A843X0R2_COLES|nr:hypothetical protein [Colocasia esculenta]
MPIPQPFFPSYNRTPKHYGYLNTLHPNPRDEFRTFWSRVEEFLVAGEQKITHTKPFFFPFLSAATCTNHPLEVDQRTNTFCKGSVDTTMSGVDTMVQNKGRNVKKSPSQVDTSPEQVDTREPSQKACCSDSQSRSTPNTGRSTLDGSPRRPVLQTTKVGRDEMRSGRH